MDDSLRAFVGSYAESGEIGIYSYRVDPTTGDLTRDDVTIAGENPSYLAVHPTGEYLYSVNQADDGMVTAYDIDKERGALTQLNRQSSGDGNPCYCSVDATGSYVLTAHYSGGSVSVLPIEADGRLGETTDIVAHEPAGVDPGRQTQPHPHSIVPGPENHFAYVPDLGTDRIVVYELDEAAGKLRPAEPKHVDVDERSGPRHFVFHPTGRFAYLVNQLNSTLTAYKRDAETGSVTELETVSTLPAGFDDENHPADVHVHPSGEWVYASNRGHDSIAIFEIDDLSGRSRLVDHESTRGEWPRDFVLDPFGKYLYAENQRSDNVVVFQIDDGRLEFTGVTEEVSQPSCMVFVPPE